MSSSPSPQSSLVAHDKGRFKRRDKPSALEFSEATHVSDPGTRSDRDMVREAQQPINQPSFHISNSGEPEQETAVDLPRSPSATSSLDPYYFSVRTPSDSPIPVPLSMSHLAPKTPEMIMSYKDPVTPGKDPAAIDRRGLVGVGELQTPRWARGGRKDRPEFDDFGDEVDEEAVGIGDEAITGDHGKDAPDSPWTIEAIDGEGDGLDGFLEVNPLSKTSRPRRSNADESGGEEILYPRQPVSPESHPPPLPTASEMLALNSTASNESLPAVDSISSSPPSAFIAQANRSRKRTSEEFEMDQSGSFVSKHTSPTTDQKEKDKASVRRHRSLGVGIPSSSPASRDKVRERKRDTLSTNTKHLRQTSTSSSSGESHSRRLHASDYSHLPPSPGSSSIQQFLRHASTGSTTTSPLHSSPRDSQGHHGTAHVAHSLLRGTQEGWSDLDDQATAEALRKLDGISGRSARARSSVGGHSRVNSISRPSTPAKSSIHWESTEGQNIHRTTGMQGSLSGKDKQTSVHRASVGALADASLDTDLNGGASTGKEDGSSSAPEKSKKHGSISQRASFTPKRGSASSTNYTGTPTTSSRDSASLSTATSSTSVSAVSGRQSMSIKPRRNSAGSDISSVHSGDASGRDRAASLATVSDVGENHTVPPVPPLPKDFSTYKPVAQNSAPIVFPTTESSDDRESFQRIGADTGRNASLDIPTAHNTPSKHLSPKPTTPTNTTPHKGPSKKWSFSNPLGKKLISSPSSSSIKDSASKSGLALSPRTLSFGQQIRKSTSKDRPMTTVVQKSSDMWVPVNSDAMASASSLASLSSVGSIHHMSPPASAPLPFVSAKTPDRLVPSRTETASSSSTNLTAFVPPVPQHAPLSPSSSIRRGPSTKRLTPSSIPFFRRSSSQSMQIPAPTLPSSASPTSSTGHQFLVPGTASPPKDPFQAVPPTPGSTHKKSSVLSLGLPSLLKGSSSRRSLHSDKEKSDAKIAKAEARRARDSEREIEKSKKDEKDRSESRISVLIGRKRGKTVSSSQPKKAEPVALPPMHVSALPPSTAQRLANMNSGSSTSLASTQSTPKTSRVASQTASSMQKQSDTSLRSHRNVLPTIAGSPSVGTLPHTSSKEPPSTSLNAAIAMSKETPTKIPRISGRSSAANSPTLRGNGANKRSSIIMGSSSLTPSRGTSPTVGTESMNEFGVLENVYTPKTVVPTASQRHSIRASPSTSNPRVPRQLSTAGSSTVNGASARKNRESLSFSGLRKSSTGSVTSINIATAAQNEPQPVQHSHRFSALSPSKGLKLLSPKISLPTSKSSSSSMNPSISQAMGSPSLSHQSNSTPSPVPSFLDEEELLGDEEMMQYIKRQQAKKLAGGATQAELDELLKFPEPLPPVSSMSPAAILKSSQSQFLSEYERNEILEYPSVYYIGAGSDKKMATLENSTNNHSYDDERGDYQVVLHDHLAFRYEVTGTLGKGSFGQVLSCRDHCTGESVAIKIIRNKKRFHHQALVEIKILDSLRKWDQDEKHYVIKMTEHFYFRGHLCIAMELLSINLYELIKANGFVGFSTALIRRFTSQMLQSLALMRHHRIVHCDLKPENVLLRHPAKSGIKVIDFGSSCFEHEKIYTYIQSRFYRSPEVILGMNYHMAIDMWSLGCILAELYTGFPIFPGENEQEQLSCIMEVLGVPDKDFINRSSRKRLFFDTTNAPRPVVNSKGRRRRPGSKTLAQVLRCEDELFVDFIAKCLVWDPERRLKPQSALRHPFITAGRRPKITSPVPHSAKGLLSSTTSGFGSNRSSKTVSETPKKSLISAPTPLTARTSRVTGAVPTTPSNSSNVHASLGSSSRSYRTSQTQSLSYNSGHSNRTLLTK